MKKYFPLLANHPELVYLDNAATTQKPKMVIDGVSGFLSSEYANIHRGLYSLSELSEAHYHESKVLVAELLSISAKEIIYSYNATYAINLLAQSLCSSHILQSGDEVLLGIQDHHANILPWMSLAKIFGFSIKFFHLNENYEIDRESFNKEYTEKVKVVACSHVSNVTGMVYDVKKIGSLLREDTFFLVDASQSVPNMVVDFQDIGCDALVFTGHKMMAYTGIGILALKYERIKKIDPLIVGGGTIKDVFLDHYDLQKNNEKFEAGTPNIIGAVSLKYALSFVKSLADDQNITTGMQIIHQKEAMLTDYIQKKWSSFSGDVSLLGAEKQERVPLFSFSMQQQENFNYIGEFFADKNICIRCGGHCAYPLHKSFDLGGTCRMSAYFYNDFDDIDRFFLRLEELLSTKK